MSFYTRKGGELLYRGRHGKCSTSPFPKRARFSPDRLGDPEMGVAAENVAQKYKLTKEMQDEFAILSYTRSWHAIREGLYKPEISDLKTWAVDESF